VGGESIVTVAAITAGELALAPRPRPELPPGPYAVAGLRRAGLAAVEALCRIAPAGEVVACDRAPSSVPKRVRRNLREAGVQVLLGPDGESLGFARAPRTLIKSPGIGPDAAVLRNARRLGIAVLDELELGWRISEAPMLAVTGTNGKTTVACLARAVLAAAGMTATVAGNTEFGPPLSAVEPGPDWIVCEASSFQLEGCPDLLPEVAVFTNLTRDHLVRHRTMRRYGEAKRRLFVRGTAVVPHAVIDIADGFGRALADELQARGGRVVRVGFDRVADYAIRDVRWDLRSAVVDLRTPSGALILETRLPGVHNARNVAAAVALGDLFGVPRARLADAIATQDPPPGRLERLNLGHDHELVLDTAASPDAVEQVLRTMRAAIRPGARLHVVLGVLGTPDLGHQHALGRAAGELSDKLILTSGSLRPNAPVRTLDALSRGAASAGGASVEVISQRREAIGAALRAARPTDMVAVLGRGALTEAVSDRWLDDRAILRELCA
jgi:UDP-N-acetylmuramoyl-L-alanyl-D-glutamate--2,6-diaminopimelate ligase